MRRSVRILAIALCVSALPFALACEHKEVGLQLAAFDNGAVQGIWIWRRSEQTGQYERVCRIKFDGVRQTANGEKVMTFQDCVIPRSYPDFDVPIDIERSSSNPSVVTLHLWYVRWEDPGVYKVSAYNAYGESALSAASVPL